MVQSGTTTSDLVDIELRAKKEGTILPRASKLEPHHRVPFSVIPRTHTKNNIFKIECQFIYTLKKYSIKYRLGVPSVYSLFSLSLSLSLSYSLYFSKK